jgi:ADP-heptose:LPS heptosyltransferase
MEISKKLKILARVSKRLLKSGLSVFLYLLVKFSPKNKGVINEKTLLIIKIDAIGDYILFRNFLKIVRESPIYKDYRITLLGNGVNKSIAETLDKDFVDDFIWINKRNIFKNPFKILKLIKLISTKFETTVHAAYSREFIGDLLVRASYSKNRVGFVGDYNNITVKEKNITDKWYTELINTEPGINFEFYKNRSFFSQILKIDLSIRKPYININDTKLAQPINLPDNFIVFFPGSLVSSKQWPAQNFKELGDHLIERYNLDIVVCGSKSDDETAKVIKNTNKRIINQTGKTSLVELIYVISKAKLIISNDTSGAHIAAALGIPLIVLSRYNHYLRFIPYPREISEKIICLFPNIFKNLSEKELVEKFKNGSNEDISLISVEQVKEAVTKFITTN